MTQLTRCVQIVLTLLEVSTIPDIVQCHRRHCGYTVGQGRWLADSVIRIDAIACVLYPHCNLMECANCVSCVSASYLLDILPVMLLVDICNISWLTFRYLVLLNSSVNFLIYCFVGSNFRTTLRSNICCGLLGYLPGSLDTSEKVELEEAEEKEQINGDVAVEPDNSVNISEEEIATSSM